MRPRAALTPRAVHGAAATATARLLAGLLLLLAVLGTAAPAHAAGEPAPPAPAAGHPWFGPSLDISDDGPLQYADRLDAAPSLYTFPVDYPLTTAGTTQLRGFARQAATQGAVLVLQVEPVVPLERLTSADAAELARLVRDLHDELDTFTLVDFAPEMNGSWRPWGQQPGRFVTAFRRAADAVHAATAQAAMVWSPVYGSGYPFGRRQGTDSEIDLSERRQTALLDTDGNGRVDPADDPYGPFYPGADATDWVGLFLYRFGQSQGVEENVAPPARELRSRLAETWGYGGRGTRTPFYQRFAEDRGHPMLLETSALYNPAVGGAGELRLKRTWWRQVFAALPGHPRIGAVSWLEQRRVEPEVADQPVDWRATRSAALARALRADLERSGLRIDDPVTRTHDQETANTATAQGRIPGPSEIGSSTGWVVLCVVLLALVFLLSGLVGRLVPSWRYVEGSGARDLRVDLVRGWLILTVVITHIEVAGPYSYVTLNAVGAVTGAEGFVMLSGLVLGMIHEPLVRRVGEWAAAVVRWKRARRIYVTALVLTFGIYVLGLVPGVDATVVTTFTDRGTGADGLAARGQVYDLYVNAPRLFDYPPPWYAVRELLLLDMGPWVLNVLGLFVVLTAVLPALTWLLHRGLWWVVLALSAGCYAYARVQEPHWLPSQFEDVFPVLVWQVPFVLGLLIGYHRHVLVRALTSRVGKPACALAVVAYAGVLGFLWLSHHQGFSPAPFPADAYTGLYDRLYTRVDLQPGRLLDLLLVLVVAFAFLTTCWRPVHAAVGRLLVPLGQASLYVFVVHAFLVIAVANLPGLDRTSAWQGVVVHTVAIAALWLLVRYRVLFSVIPR